MKKLIIVADDFGFSEAYNLGVIKAHVAGVVTRPRLWQTWMPPFTPQRWPDPIQSFAWYSIQISIRESVSAHRR